MRGGIESGKALRPPTNTREASGTLKKTLDESFLLKHCYVEKPSDLCVCNISGEALQEVSCDSYRNLFNLRSGYEGRWGWRRMNEVNCVVSVYNKKFPTAVQAGRLCSV